MKNLPNLLLINLGLYLHFQNVVTEGHHFTYCLALLDVIADEIGLQGPSNTDDNTEDVVDENPSPSSPGSDSGQCADHGSYCDGARGDGYCDDYCNYADCNFDDGDCCGDDVNTLVCDECLCKE